MSNKSYPDPDAIDLNTNKELIKILTWNLWWKFENFKDREKLIFQELRSLIPDIMCLQEVWVEEDESQVKKIADDKYLDDKDKNNFINKYHKKNYSYFQPVTKDVVVDYTNILIKRVKTFDK